MKAFPVSDNLGVQNYILWLLLFTGRVYTARLDHQVKSLECFNDYKTEMFCSWEVKAVNHDCRSEFNLSFTTNKDENGHYFPQNVVNCSTILSKKCICYFESVAFFVSSDIYNITIESQGRPLDRLHVSASNTVKPVAPANVTIDQSEKDSVILRWNNMYTESNLGNYLNYEIQVTNKQDPEEVYDITLEQPETKHKMDKRQWRQGYDYTAKVRSKPVKNYQGTWSEWSEAVEWHNDYSSTVSTLWKIYLSISCIAILVLTLLCYVSIQIGKKKWWNNIPDPAKSELIQQKMRVSQGSVLKLDDHSYVSPRTSRKQKIKRACSHWLNKWIFRTPDQNEKPDQYFRNEKDSGSQSRSPQLLTPELPNIESHIELLPIEYDQNNISTEISEDDGINPTGDEISGDEDLNNPMDLMINQMFLDILEGSACNMGVSTCMVEEPGMHQEEDGGFVAFSIFPDVPSEDSVTSVYHHTSNNSTNELQTNFNGYKLFCPDEWSGGPYTPKDDLVQSLSVDPQRADTFADSGYNSFASAVSGVENKTTSANNVDHDSASSLCFDQFQSSSCFESSSFFYNTNPCLSFHDDGPNSFDSRSAFTPQPEVSEYQCFAKAVQQDNLSIDGSVIGTVMDSRYKSFDSVVNRTTEESDLVHVSCLLELIPDESCHPYKKQSLTETAHCLKDSSVDTAVNFEDDLQHKYSSSFLNINPTECCLDEDCKRTTIEKSHLSYAKDSSYQNNIVANVELDIKPNTTVALQNQKNRDISLALTFDIADHLKNFANLNGKNSLGKRKYQNVATFTDTDEVICSCPGNHNMNLSKSMLASIRDQRCFTDVTNSLKFENVTSSVPPYHLKPVLLHSEVSASKTLDGLLVQYKGFDKEGNSYMEVV